MEISPEPRFLKNYELISFPQWGFKSTCHSSLMHEIFPSSTSQRALRIHIWMSKTLSWLIHPRFVISDVLFMEMQFSDFCECQKCFQRFYWLFFIELLIHFFCYNKSELTDASSRTSIKNAHNFPGSLPSSRERLPSCLTLQNINLRFSFDFSFHF